MADPNDARDDTLNPAASAPGPADETARPLDAPAVRDHIEDPHAALERAFIEEFLRGRGHTLRSVAQLPQDEATALLRAAAAYATLRLTEIESRAHFIEELEP